MNNYTINTEMLNDAEPFKINLGKIGNALKKVGKGIENTAKKAVSGTKKLVSGNKKHEETEQTNDTQDTTETTVPQTTVPQTTVPQTTIPQTTAPQGTKPFRVSGFDTTKVYCLIDPQYSFCSSNTADLTDFNLFVAQTPIQLPSLFINNEHQTFWCKNKCLSDDKCYGVLSTYDTTNNNYSCTFYY